MSRFFVSLSFFLSVLYQQLNKENNMLMDRLSPEFDFQYASERTETPETLERTYKKKCFFNK